jgi:hypothetical protein
MLANVMIFSLGIQVTIWSRSLFLARETLFRRVLALGRALAIMLNSGKF